MDLAAESISQQITQRNAWSFTATPMLEGAWGIQIIGRPQEGIQVSDVSEIPQWRHHDHPSWKIPHCHCKHLDSLDYQLKRLCHRKNRKWLKCRFFHYLWQGHGNACFGMLGRKDIRDMCIIGGTKDQTFSSQFRHVLFKHASLKIKPYSQWIFLFLQTSQCRISLWFMTTSMDFSGGGRRSVLRSPSPNPLSFRASETSLCCPARGGTWMKVYVLLH